MEQMISSLGFPIVSTCALSGAMYGVIKYFLERDKINQENMNKLIENLREDNNIDREMYKDTIEKFDCKLDKFAIALENNNSELGAIKEDIRNIKEKVGV